jgi:glycosyltransferase involved in cell wall biosynthesis
MKILILTFYFPPDLSACSFRMNAFVQALKDKIGKEDRIDIITTFPHRYSSFSADCQVEEKLAENIFLTRIKLPAHKSGFIDQARSFTVFLFAVLKLIKKRKFDCVFATTSRLFTGFLGAVASKRLNAPLYLDVRDIFTDTMDSILPARIALFLVPVFKRVERYTLRRAKKINIVSEGFKNYLKRIVPKTEFSYFTNGIDDIFLERDFSQKRPVADGKIIITYAGNIGQGQGLDKIIPDMAERLGNDFTIQIIGDGGIRHKLECELANRKINNVIIKAPVNRDALLDAYQESDCLFLHLNDCEAFKKVLPSKIFEYAATGKPIIAGVAGYAGEFLEKYVPGCIVFQPCNAEDLFAKFPTLKFEHCDRSPFIDMFKRDQIMNLLADDVLAIGRSCNKK